MRNIDELLTDYASYHRARGNIVCHTIGIPLIVYASIALLLLIRIPGTFATAAEVILLLACVYYLTLDYRLAFLMLLITVLMDLLARQIELPAAAVVAMVAGWILQFIGHAVYEKKSPAFVRNLQHLLIGPIFIIDEYLHVRAARRAI